MNSVPESSVVAPDLRRLPTVAHMSTSTHQMIERFYVPALAQALQYDRGVGYFTSAWLRLVASGLIELARNGGVARIIASPKLDAADCAALSQGADARDNPVLRAALERELEQLAADLATDTLTALAWMVADGLLDFRVAIPSGHLDGDFHDKFGIFRDGAGNAIAFHGSPNDSERAFRNYESISIYYSWVDAREAGRVESEQERFDLLWANRDANLRLYELPEAIRKNLIEFTSRSTRPYARPIHALAIDERWHHQREAVSEFLKHRNGILEMATGTGKTRTALAILEELKERRLIESAIVTAFGTDLLDQWHKELVQHTTLPIYRAYEQHREAQAYLNAPHNAVLLTSRQSLTLVLPRLQPQVAGKGLLICDEVHGMGSPALVAALRGRLRPFRFRLGLSATPEREYDPEGTKFIDSEIGPVIFRFGLKEAIERGILCEFDYVELAYTLSEDDRTAIRQAVRRYHAKVSAGEGPPVETLYRDIARVRKLTTEKILPFRVYVRQDPGVLQRCIIFVETAEYGALIQPILMDLHVDFHTYYQDDDRGNLQRFARGDLQCLLTCHRLSEGIDIRSVNNIVLFASARARLETVQRLGRCLRVDPENVGKRARVVDFIEPETREDDDPTDESSADEERRDWIRALAEVRRLPQPGA